MGNRFSTATPPRSRLFTPQVKERITSQWRNSPPFDKEYLMTLKNKIQEYRPPAALDVSEVRILMIGPVGAGKSSFANTINSIFEDEINTGLCRAGNAMDSRIRSVTMEYRQYKIRSKESSKPLNFRMCDTCGIEKDEGPDLVDLFYILKGNVKDRYQFNPSQPIDEKSKDFRPNPELNDMIHCVIFVFDATSVHITPTALWDKVNQLQKRMGDIPRFAVLTKIDSLWDRLKCDITMAYVSKDVEEAVSLVSKKLGIIPGNVLPVQNYENHSCLNDSISILALQALDRMLSDAKSYLYSLEDLMENK